MKKLVTILAVMLCTICLFGCIQVYAANSNQNVLNEVTDSKLVAIKDKELKTMDDYKDAYGSDAYGIAAYILNKIRIYSIPIGFVAIAWAAIHQYIIGIKKLDERDKGFGLMITSITLLVI